MDLSNNLSAADLLPGGVGATIDKVASSLMPESKAAKAKDAVKAINAHQYWTLRPYLKNMEQIPQYVIDMVKGKNVAYFAILCLPAQSSTVSDASTLVMLQNMTKAGRDAITGIDPTSQAAKPEALLIVGADGTAVAPGTTSSTVSISTYLPYIIGAIILGIVVWFIMKKK
jgi:hypothetical protein